MTPAPDDRDLPLVAEDVDVVEPPPIEPTDAPPTITPDGEAPF